MKCQTIYFEQSLESGIKHPRSFITENVPLINLSGVATQIEEDDFQKTTYLVEVIYDLLEIYGYGDKKSFSRSTLLEGEHKLKTKRDKAKLVDHFNQFVKKAGPGSWVKLFKYKINAFFSQSKDQDIPPVPPGLELPLLEPGFLCFGRAKRFLQIMKNDNLKKYESFALSLALGGKKGAPAVHPSMVSDAMLKTFVHLTSDHPDNDDFVIQDSGNFFHEVNRHTVCYQLRRTIREVFHGCDLKRSDLTKPVFPSTSSHYNFSRGNLGAIGSFLENSEVQKLLGESQIDVSLTQAYLSGELTDLYGEAGKKDQQEIDDRDFENIYIKESIAAGFDLRKLETNWDTKIYPSLLSDAMGESPRAVVIGLPEPLKVRNITAGPPITQTVLKPMQKWLWNHLHRLQTFQLIGRPVSTEVVMQQLGVLGEDEEFVSGDYVASTDNLHSWVSECLLDELIILLTENNLSECDGGVPPEWLDSLRILMKRALTGHKILNPCYMDQYVMGNMIRDEWFHDQREGQLMGSIISFPFLCLANAALCRWAMEITASVSYSLIDRPLKGYMKCPLLLNGDDCVFRGQKAVLFENWKGITGFGGLGASEGKTFKDARFLQINSTQYEYQVPGWEEASGTSSDGYYHEFKYVNLGLVYAQKKDGARGKDFFKLGALHRDLARTCPAGMFDAASKKFLKEACQTKFNCITYGIEVRKNTYWRVDGDRTFRQKEGSNETFMEVRPNYFSNLENSELPWFLPQWLGGIGLIPFGEHQVSKWELMCAGYIRDHINKFDFNCRSYMTEDFWKTHKLVRKSLEDFAFLGEQRFSIIGKGDDYRSLEAEYEKFYASMCINQLFVSPIDSLARGVKTEETLKEKYQSLSYNRKVWASVRDKLYSNPQIYWYYYNNHPSLDDVLYEKKKFPLACYDLTNRQVGTSVM